MLSFADDSKVARCHKWTLQLAFEPFESFSESAICRLNENAHREGNFDLRLQRIKSESYKEFRKSKKKKHEISRVGMMVKLNFFQAEFVTYVGKKSIRWIF